MISIIIKNKTCQILGNLDQEIISKLDTELSFKVTGSEYSPAYKFGSWDGRKYLLEPNLCFPYGLFNRVSGILTKNNIQFDVISDRYESKNKPIDILDKLKSLNKVPYDYQLQAVNDIIKHDCGIIRMGTGSGKSLVIALLTAYLNKETIIYVIGLDLLYQLHSLFVSIFGEDSVGMIGDGHCDIKKFTIVSVWTAGVALGLKKGDIAEDLDDEKKISSDKYKIIKKAIQSAKISILDECHVAKSNTIAVINENVNSEYFYGFSASPVRYDELDAMVYIESILGPKIVDISASDLIKKGFLVQPLIKFVDVPKMSFSKSDRYQTIYKEYVVENNYRNGLVIGNAVNLVDKGYKVLVLYRTIAHGELLYSKLKELIHCTLLSGKDSAEIRDKAKKDIEEGNIKCIIVSQIFDLGVDIPCLDGLVLAGSGKSSIRALQRIGRVVRRTPQTPNKQFAAVVDYVDNAKYLKDHSKARYEIYKTEPGFKVSWPKKK